MRAAIFLALAALALASPASAQQQIADPSFRPVVERPAFNAGRGPTLAIDAAHANFHTMDGRYKAFADLARADGFTVRGNDAKLDATGALDGVKVLVIANANAPEGGGAAFSEGECTALQRWVDAGGGLLLIADHAPFGAAAESLGQCFGIGMGKGWVYDAEIGARSMTTTMTFTRAGGELADHPIVRGRRTEEQVRVVRAFTGQSLTVPEGAAPLMTLPPSAREAPDTDALNAAAARVREGTAPAEPTLAPGRVQGLAMMRGAGRIVALGEAGMFSAQIVRMPGQEDRKFGMNTAGHDNQQFALNVMRWLAGR